MSRPRGILRFIFVGAIAGWSAGGATTRPSGSAVVDEAAIARWVRQLGDDSYAKREAASAALLSSGKAALPALRAAAADGTDLEIVSRAQRLIEQLTAPPAPSGKVLREALPILNSKRPRILQARVVEPGVNEVSSAIKSAAALVVRRDAKGISVVVSVESNGMSESETYRAENPQSLAKEHPQAYELYADLMRSMSGDKDMGGPFHTWFESAANAK
jgi:hypothetical protein